MAEKKSKTGDRFNKISVIVPAYNVENYIAYCIHTICIQNYGNYEVIVVDDGSTDTTGKIIDELAKDKPELVKPYHIKNRGLSGARNFGISKATGKYLAFVDGDDMIEDNFLSSLYENIANNHSDVAVCGFADARRIKRNKSSFINAGDSFIENEEVPEKEECISGEDYTIRLLTKQENLDIVVWNKLYRKSLFDDVKFPEGKNFEDNLTTYKVVSKAKKVSTVCNSLYQHLVRSDSIMHISQTTERLSAKIRAAEDAMKYFKDNSSLFYAAEYSLILAYFQFVDYAARGEIEETYFDEYRSKILKMKDRYSRNPFKDRKRTAYIKMLEFSSGKPYRAFRRK